MLRPRELCNMCHIKHFHLLKRPAKHGKSDMNKFHNLLKICVTDHQKQDKKRHMSVQAQHACYPFYLLISPRHPRAPFVLRANYQTKHLRPPPFHNFPIKICVAKKCL